ncbi:hypothetical protein PM082_017815 [Marasmius tenuissimus]|nr:hypothetical protein PM082_017815 [Marasmius tenuissimus]
MDAFHCLTAQLQQVVDRFILTGVHQLIVAPWGLLSNLQSDSTGSPTVLVSRYVSPDPELGLIHTARLCSLERNIQHCV